MRAYLQGCFVVIFVIRPPIDSRFCSPNKDFSPILQAWFGKKHDDVGVFNPSGIIWQEDQKSGEEDAANKDVEKEGVETRVLRLLVTLRVSSLHYCPKAGNR